MNIGGQFQFSAEAFDISGKTLDGVIFLWTVTDPSVATIDQTGLVTAHTPGVSEISASARRTRSVAVTLTVNAPSPTPTPFPTPTPTPTPTPLPSPVPSPPVPKVVISEFRTRGPNGAGDEFVELYNNSDVAVDISGWKVRTSSSGGTISTRLTINSETFIPSRGHFLAANANGYSGTVAGDQTFASGLANDGGLALTLPDNSIVDQVGLSAGSTFRENMHLAPLPSDSNQSYERKPGGPSGSTQDTDNNFDDFQLLTPSNPENRTSSPTPGPSPLPSPSPSQSPTPLPSPTTTPAPSPSPTPAPRIVISQVYGGGGNAGAPLRNDFIELFNPTTISVNLDGWSVQYATATGSSWSVTNLGNISLAPGQYYLIKQASGGNNGADLPPEDVAGNTAMAATAGKVALVNSTTRLSGTCPASADIVDLVGYGTNASCFRGSGPSRAPGNATSALRLNGGCVDTQNNIGDFEIAAPIPRNSSNSNFCQLSIMRFRSIANCRLSIDDFLLGKLRGERKEVTSVSLKIGNRQLAIDMLLRVSVYRS
jgi:predicted extracellular nuclease